MGPGLQLVKAFLENDPSQLNNFWVFMVGPFFGGYLAQLFYWDIYVPFAYKQP
jgi:glycerol uptake facilitator-like aquaporin